MGYPIRHRYVLQEDKPCWRQRFKFSSGDLPGEFFRLSHPILVVLAGNAAKEKHEFGANNPAHRAPVGQRPVKPQ